MNRALGLLAILLTGIVIVLPLRAQEKGFANQHEFFVDTNFVYEKGTELSKTFLKETAPDFSKRLPTLIRWVTRVEVRHSINEKGYQSNHGTGVVLADGQVLTARHVLEQNVPDDTKDKLKILLTLNDGRVVEATVRERGKLDWTLLQIAQPDNEANAIDDKGLTNLFDSPIQVAVAKPKSTLAFVGYPARLGVDAKGVVRAFNKGNPKANIPVTLLDPCLVVGQSQKESLESDSPGPLYLDPLAGFPPAGGMSGGPIFDLSGSVVGIQVGVTKTTADATGEVLSYRIDGVSTAAIAPLKE